MGNLVILGMHRSGTSVIAEQLHRAGLSVGDPEALLAPQLDNPRGFWERRDVVQLNDALLAAAGGSWFSPPGEPPVAALSQCREMEKILAELAAAGPWLMKDPRLTLTWPVWAGPVARMGESRLLLVVRDPVAVAVSLHHRNGFPLALGLGLWEWYNRRALSMLDEQALVVSYDWLMEDPQAHTRMLLENLRKRGVACAAVPTENLLQQRRHGVDIPDPVRRQAQSLLARPQRELHEALLGMARQGTIRELPEVDDSLWPAIRDLAESLAPLATARETGLALEELRKRADELEARTRELQASLEESRTALKQTSAARDQLRHERDVLQANLEASRTALDQANAARDALQASLETSRAALDQAHAERDTLQASLLESRTALQQTGIARDQLCHERDILQDALRRGYRQLLCHEASVLGRLQRWQRYFHRRVLRRGHPPGAYECALEDARAHFIQHDLPLPERAPGKLSQLQAVFLYLLRHPVSSLRGFSFHRLKRALGVLLTSSPADFSVWVRSRFPAEAAPGECVMPVTPDPMLDGRQLVFPSADQPRVSIVVPVFNEYRMTLQCLSALLEHTQGVDYEVIIADDASSDLTLSIEERVSNVRVLRQPKNLGFLGNCNAAAALARGEYLVFLNNDTAVSEGWLAPLVALLDHRADVGIAGPRLLFADGRLQEAGGIVWKDGSAWNYGRGDDLQKPQYEYVKEVDYISGACLLVRRTLWDRLGGFDLRYAPAYYEDTDLCFAARQAGFRVCLQPHSVVFHFEGTSNGTDEQQGIKHYQTLNRDKFLQKWRAVLEREHFANGQHVFLARDRSRDRNCILVIDHYVPHFDKDAGSRSTLMYLQLMVEMGFRVVFLGANFFPHQPYTRHLQDLGIEVLVGEHIARHLDRWLQDNARYIHRVYLHRPHVAEQFLPHLERMQPRPPVVFFGHDLHYLRVGREEALGGLAGESGAAGWKARELAVMARVDQVYYPSLVEVEALQTECPGLPVRQLPLYVFNDVAIPDYAPRAPHSILFVAGFNHPPNLHGLNWLVDAVLPGIREHCPDIHLHVVGSNPTQAVLDLHCDRITVHGYVSDASLASLYREVACAVVPLRYGAGVKGKVLEAIQHGVPLVTTSIGAEGLQAPEQVMFIADAPEDFATAVADLLLGRIDPSARLAGYAQWLQESFGRARAEAILLEDFGPVRRDATRIDGEQS